jgi:hypothetical protein
LNVFDVDGNGGLDKGEFSVLYDCVPGLDPNELNAVFAAHSPIDSHGIERFLDAAFGGNHAEMEAAALRMMELGATLTGAKLQQRKASPTRRSMPADPDYIAVEVSPAHVSAADSLPAAAADLLSLEETLRGDLSPQSSEHAVIDVRPPPQDCISLGGSTRCSPELMAKISETLPRLFDRYDADCSGTLNSQSELQQLTVNLTFNLSLRIKPEKLQALVRSTPIDSWSPDVFQSWYIDNVLPLNPKR